MSEIDPSALEKETAYLIVKHSHLIDFIRLTRMRGLGARGRR